MKRCWHFKVNTVRMPVFKTRNETCCNISAKPAKKDVARPGVSGDFKRFIDQIKCELSINRSVFLPERFGRMQERETWMFMLMHANMQPSLSASPFSVSAPHTYVCWPSCAAAAIHVCTKTNRNQGCKWMQVEKKKKKNSRGRLLAGF